MHKKTKYDPMILKFVFWPSESLGALLQDCWSHGAAASVKKGLNFSENFSDQKLQYFIQIIFLYQNETAIEYLFVIYK